MKLRADRLEERRSEATQSNAEWRKLSPKEQLEALDTRLGVGKGATRQRKLLGKAEAKS